MISTSMTALKESLERHNDTFESLLKLIPPKYYLVSELSEEQAASKYQKHSKKNKTPKQAIKEASKKARKEKLDPANNKTVLDIQTETHSKRLAESEKKRKADEAFSEEDEGEDEDENEEIADAEEPIDLDDPTASIGETSTATAVPLPAPSSISVLREKLHARIAALQHTRQSKSRNATSEAQDKDELLEERRQQRAAVLERRRKKKDGKKDMEKGKKKDTTLPVQSQLIVPDPPRIQEGLTNVAFSAVSGSSSKKPKFLSTASNPAQALDQLAARKSRLAAMPDDKRKTVEEREKWNKAEARLDGVKIRDDEARLKKAVKKKEKDRLKSKKVWTERKEAVAASMAAKVKKRSDNIAMRHERRNEKRKPSGKSKGKGRPGFEGKSFGKKGKTKS